MDSEGLLPLPPVQSPSIPNTAVMWVAMSFVAWKAGIQTQLNLLSIWPSHSLFRFKLRPKYVRSTSRWAMSPLFHIIFISLHIVTLAFALVLLDVQSCSNPATASCVHCLLA
jgi:hypothetical protein